MGVLFAKDTGPEIVHKTNARRGNVSPPMWSGFDRVLDAIHQETTKIITNEHAASQLES